MVGAVFITIHGWWPQSFNGVVVAADTAKYFSGFDETFFRTITNEDVLKTVDVDDADIDGQTDPSSPSSSETASNTSVNSLSSAGNRQYG